MGLRLLSRKLKTALKVQKNVDFSLSSGHHSSSGVSQFGEAKLEKVRRRRNFPQFLSAKYTQHRFFSLETPRGLFSGTSHSIALDRANFCTLFVIHYCFVALSPCIGRYIRHFVPRAQRDDAFNVSRSRGCRSPPPRPARHKGRHTTLTRAQKSYPLFH